MRKDRLLESILYIINYDYKSICDRYPELNSSSNVPELSRAYFYIKIIGDEYSKVACLSWNERGPVTKIKKYYYNHLKRFGVFDEYGRLNISEFDLNSIDSIEAWIEADTDGPRLKLFSCSDEGIVEVLKMD